jgi:hypothetical protein
VKYRNRPLIHVDIVGAADDREPDELTRRRLSAGVDPGPVREEPVFDYA